jgi:ribosome-associated protein
VTGGRPEPDGDTGGPGEPPGRPTVLHVRRGVAIPLSELRWRFSTSSGPGGQHANRSSTRAEVILDVATSSGLGPRQRARLLERCGPEVRASASDERSQARNRQLALERLATLVAAALRDPRQRIPTAPSAGARARRLEGKRHQAARKRERTRRIDLDD